MTTVVHEDTGLGTMPRGEGDLTIEGHGIEPVPTTARYGAVYRVFTVWFTPNLVPAAFAIGTLAVAFASLGFWTGLAAIVLGNIISAALVGALAVMGPRTGMAQIPASRLPFGKTIVVPAVINWASTIAWDAINAFFGAYALDVLSGGALPFPVSLAIVVLCQAGLSIVGYEAIHTFEKYAAIGLLVLFAVVTVAALPNVNTGFADNGSTIWTFILMTTIAGSFNFAWALYASDYTRYLPEDAPPSRVFLYTFLGLGLSAAWLEILGLAVTSALSGDLASADGTHQIYAIVGQGFVGSLAMIAIFFGTVGVNAMNDYTGSLSLLAAGVRIWRPISAAVVGVLSFLATLWLYYGSFNTAFENYLLLITYWIGPWAAIVLVDWRLRGGRFDVRRVTPFGNLPSGRNAIIALVVGFGVSIPFFNQSLYVGPLATALGGTDITYVVGFIVAAAVYWFLERSSPTAVPAA